MYADTNKEMDIIGTVNDQFFHKGCAPVGSSWQPFTEYDPSGSACGKCIKVNYEHRFIAVIVSGIEHFI